MTGSAFLLLGAFVLPPPQDVHAQQHDHTMRDPRPRPAAVAAVPSTPLGDRIAAAAPGDTIRLGAGVHRAPIRIDRRITLIGDPGAVLDAGGIGTVVTMTADSAELQGIIVRNGGQAIEADEASVKLVGCDGCRVHRVRVEGALHGIYVQTSADVLIEDNAIAGNETLDEARRGNGIHLYSSTGARVRRNVVRRTRDGIYFSFTRASRVEDNDVAEVRYGLHYMYSDDNCFTRNRFIRNAAGAAIMFSKRIVFEENVFAEHVGYRAYGILLQTSDDIEAKRNRIEGNLVGVFLDNASNNLFRDNRIAGNGVGIDLIPSAERNTFVENLIVDNRTAVRKATGGGENAFAAAGRGNYWGDPSVFDLDGDGIGDRPYRASDPFASIAATRPVLEVFARTPAARALSWAERTFPVFDLPYIEDPYPLAAEPDLMRVDAVGARAPGTRLPLAGALLTAPLALGAAWRLRRSRR
jgi:nitrous oxidase accessory protein